MRHWAWLAIGFVLVQVVLGGAVRLTGSGLSCPDWPLCYGLWLPTPEALATVPGLFYEDWQVWLEWLHRANAAVVIAPLVLLLVLTAPSPRRRLLALGAAVLLAVQALLGAFTVLDRNSPWSVAVHLAFALVLLVVLVGSATGSQRSRAHALPLSGPCKKLPWAGTALAIAVAGTGAFLAKSGAAAACPSGLLCEFSTNSRYLDRDVQLHLLHRALAALTVVPALVLLVRLPRWQVAVAYRWAVLTPVVFVLQAGLGLATAAGAGPDLGLALALAHQLVGAGLVVAYAALSWYVLRER